MKLYKNGQRMTYGHNDCLACDRHGFNATFPTSQPVNLITSQSCLVNFYHYFCEVFKNGVKPSKPSKDFNTSYMIIVFRDDKCAG